MEGLPVTLVLKGRRCLVVGGGSVAARKTRLLLRVGAEVHVVAPRIVGELRDLASAGAIRYAKRRFERRDVAGAMLVVAATGDRSVNAEAAAAARRRGIPVNVADDPALCTFTMPALVDRAPLSIAISTGGASPVLARYLRAEIERAVPKEIAALACLARGQRGAVRARLRDPAARRRFWEAVLEGPIAQRALSGRMREAEAMLTAALSRAPTSTPLGRVHLVGAGPGDPELLTLKAWRLLQSADVIVYDRLVGRGVLDLARRDAERIFVGKRCGRPSPRQAAINALLISLARAGKRVVRLKGGDPFVFGRGGEEMQALIAAGIACEVVPGITAALGCAAYGGIPLTHRDYAHSCVFVTGHRSGGVLDLDWVSLARPLQTVCVYMGMSSLDALAEGLIRHGCAARTPAAIVLDGTMRGQRVLVGQLGNLPLLGGRAGAHRSGLVIVGEVVALRGRTRTAAGERAAFQRNRNAALRACHAVINAA